MVSEVPFSSSIKQKEVAVKDYLQLALAKVRENLIGELQNQVNISIRGLSVQEAIGTPERQDYPIQKNKEIMIQSDYQGYKGQAFTTNPTEFVGSLQEVFELDSKNLQNRAILIATLNSLASYLGFCKGTIHCHDQEPEECGRWIVEQLQSKKCSVGMIGLNPAILQNLCETGISVRCSDLDADFIGRNKFGCTIEDGSLVNQEMIENSDFVLFTGSTLCNDSFDKIMDSIESHKKEYAIFGTTAAGVCGVLDLSRFCQLSK